jgi:FHS family L-fucose permease-like MFS transporter
MPAQHEGDRVLGAAHEPTRVDEASGHALHTKASVPRPFRSRLSVALAKMQPGVATSCTRMPVFAGWPPSQQTSETRMAFQATGRTTPTPGPTPTAASAEPQFAPHLRVFVFALFFVFGGITSLNDVIIPKLRGLFTLSYAEAMLVQSAFFAAYFVVSIPAAVIVEKVGYMRSAVIGLLTMTAGCLLFVPASSSGLFPVFLVALFVLASGITIVQVVANPLISMLGAPATAPSRLTFAQAFNSLGTTVFPYVGSILILGSLATVDPSQLRGAALSAFRSQQTHVIVNTYVGLALALCVVAALVWQQRHSLVEKPADDVNWLQAFGLLARPRFALGAACIFLYVGAEVSIGSLIVTYLVQSNVMGLAEQAAGKQARAVLLGRRDARSLRRRVSAAAVFARQGVGVRGRGRDHVAAGVVEHHGRDLGLVAAGDRVVQLDHVPDHLLAGFGRFGRARARGLGFDLHGDRRRRHRAAVDRPCCRSHELEVRARGAGVLLRGHPQLRGVCAASGPALARLTRRSARGGIA